MYSVLAGLHLDVFEHEGAAQEHLQVKEILAKKSRKSRE